MERADQQNRLGQAAQHRRQLAERQAVELARAWRGRHGTGNDYLASTAVQVKLESAPEAATALRQAPAAIANGGEVGSVTGSALVMYVHGRPGDGWSLVFPFLPFTGLVLVCIDDLPDHCMQLDDYGEEARRGVSDLYAAATMALKTTGSPRWAGCPPSRPPTPLLRPSEAGRLRRGARRLGEAGAAEVAGDQDGGARAVLGGFDSLMPRLPATSLSFSPSR